MLKSHSQSSLSSGDSLSRLPLSDLKDVVTRALELQEAQRERRDAPQAQHDEQVRMAVIQAAREMGVSDHYLRLAADQVLRERMDAMESRLERNGRIRRVAKACVLWALLSLATWWSARHLGLLLTLAGVALCVGLYYYKWRFIDLNNMNHYKPTRPLITPEDYIDYLNGKRE